MIYAISGAKCSFLPLFPVLLFYLLVLLFVLGRLSTATTFTGPIRTTFTHTLWTNYIFLFGH